VDLLKAFAEIAATIFITSLVFGFRQLYKSQKVELKAHVSKSHTTLVDLMHEMKVDLMVEIGLIHTEMIKNNAKDENRDYKINELKKEVKEIKSNQPPT